MFFKKLENLALTFLLVALLLTACKEQSINVNDPVYKTGELLKGFASAWSDRDGDKLVQSGVNKQKVFMQTGAYPCKSI
jgi:hypothetical protein